MLKFQFHEGPIKTLQHNLLLNLCRQFQFHEGPIKTGESPHRYLHIALFQFHEGPIKTALQREYAWSYYVSIP